MYKYLIILPLLSSFLPGTLEFLLLYHIKDDFFVNIWDILFVTLVFVLFFYRALTLKLIINKSLIYSLFVIYIISINIFMKNFKFFDIQLLSLLFFISPLIYFSQYNKLDLLFVNKLLIILIVYLTIHNIIFAFIIPLLGKLFFPFLLTLKSAYMFEGWWNGYIVRIATPAGSAVTSGYIMVLATFSYVLIQKIYNKNINKYLLLLSFIFTVTTLSRGAIALWLVLFFINIFKLNFLNKKSVYHIGLLVIFISFFIGLPQAMIKRLSDEAISSNHARFVKYQNAIYMINQNSDFFGYGYMTGENRSELAFYPSLRKLKKVSKLLDYQPGSTENIFLLYSVEIGIVSTVLLFLMLLLLNIFYFNSFFNIMSLYIFMFMFDSSVIFLKVSIFVYLFIHLNFAYRNYT